MAEAAGTALRRGLVDGACQRFVQKKEGAQRHQKPLHRIAGAADLTKANALLSYISFSSEQKIAQDLSDT
ncbi:MAG: hypothetical protein IPP23_13175 [Sphingomonadales bacterium]|nr:hypothetical protein [Sphingomonadales bacterium]